MAMQMPPVFTPMLASLGGAPFDSKDHAFEIKWDGVRTLCFCERGRTRIYSRTGREVTEQYPEFADLHSKMRVKSAIFDGEIVALDSEARPSFERLQQRINIRGSAVARAMASITLDLVLFDVVFIDGRWIGDRELMERSGSLVQAIDFGDRVVLSDKILEHGTALFEAAGQRGLEGIVAKRLGSIYVPGRRSKDWIKLKVVQRVDCVIGGWSPGQGSRSSSMGSLMLGLFDGSSLRYIGSVGTGFTERTLAAIKTELESRRGDVSPFAERVPVKGATWVRPELVCEVEYREATSQLRLRAPSFKGLRGDKLPEDCTVDQIVRRVPDNPPG